MSLAPYLCVQICIYVDCIWICLCIELPIFVGIALSMTMFWSMAPYLCFWLCICVYGSLFVALVLLCVSALYLILWLCICVYGSIFVAMALYLRVWLCICVHGSVFVSMALFMSMALYLCLWICICVYGPEYISVKKIFQNIRPERVFFDGRTLQNITEHYRLFYRFTLSLISIHLLSIHWHFPCSSIRFRVTHH